jgi:hypothetical protein
MKAELNKWFQEITFKNLCYNLGIEPVKQTKSEKFNEWMLKMGNIHYHDHEAMIKAFEIVNQ